MSERGLAKTRVGTVIRDKMDKTVVVEISRTVLHPLYKKYLVRRKSYLVHDEENACRVGDKVRIAETRPLSKRKRWRVREKLR
ncbi:MAG: 30S ribosomal protein S17 [Acidobacteriota bacterium]|nr:MAG: 30S ribosomal protein S17 [Acidobacteriota bacterium]